jgi:hypothetical protein
MPGICWYGDFLKNNKNPDFVIPAAFNSVAGQAGIHFDVDVAFRIEKRDQDGFQRSLG